MFIRAKHSRGFDSRLENSRYIFLLAEVNAGRISGLERQVAYPLEVNGRHICTYIADFVYTRDNRIIVEDVKGFTTDVFRLKRALFRAIKGFDILIV